MAYGKKMKVAASKPQGKKPKGKAMKSGQAGQSDMPKKLDTGYGAPGGRKFGNRGTNDWD